MRPGGAAGLFAEEHGVGAVGHRVEFDLHPQVGRSARLNALHFQVTQRVRWIRARDVFLPVLHAVAIEIVPRREARGVGAVGGFPGVRNAVAIAVGIQQQRRKGAGYSAGPREVADDHAVLAGRAVGCGERKDVRGEEVDGVAGGIGGPRSGTLAPLVTEGRGRTEDGDAKGHVRAGDRILVDRLENHNWIQEHIQDGGQALGRSDVIRGHQGVSAALGGRDAGDDEVGAVRAWQVHSVEFPLVGQRAGADGARGEGRARWSVGGRVGRGEREPVRGARRLLRDRGRDEHGEQGIRTDDAAGGVGDAHGIVAGLAGLDTGQEQHRVGRSADVRAAKLPLIAERRRAASNRRAEARALIADGRRGLRLDGDDGRELHDERGVGTRDGTGGIRHHHAVQA